MLFNNKNKRLAEQIDELNSQIALLQKEKTNLDQNRQHLKQAFEKINLGLILLHKDNKNTLLNNAASKILEAELLDINKIREIATAAFEGRKVKEKLQLAYNTRTIEVKAVPLISKNGTNSCLVTLEDTTKLDALADVKKDFIANVSHDLRTPITSIKSLTEALLAGAKDDPETLNRFLEELDQQSERLSALARDILDLAQIENKNTLALKKLAIAPLIRQSVNIFKHQAEGKNLNIGLKIDGNPEAKADAEQLLKAFNNLLDNSIKYTPKDGKVIISVGTQNGHVKIAFQDTGIGITQKELPRIFERFYRVSKSRSIKTGGTGLGLSIVKHVIENHSGKITVKSQLHKGSEFIITLPN